MKISLIIPSFNEEKYIADCLDHAIKNSHGTFHEIIVVDNASTDRTNAIASSFPGVKVVQEEKKGLTKARERGRLEATGELLAYIDADTRLPPGWVEKAESIFSKYSDAVSLSGPYKYYDGTIFQRFVMTALWRISAPITYAVVGYMLLGGNFIAKKEALAGIGGFDQSIEFYGEDTDIARRLHKEGKVLFRMDFFIYSSLRRISKEGIVKANLAYALNFAWEVVFKKPFTKNHKDIREIIR